MPGRNRDKYLPGLSYGMSGGPQSIAWREGAARPAPPDRKVVACCIKCRQATKIWDYGTNSEYPISYYYWRCLCTWVNGMAIQVEPLVSPAEWEQ